MDNGGLRYGAVEGALRPPLPTATHPPFTTPSRPSQAKNPRPLDQAAAPKHHRLDPRKRTLGGRLQIGIPAGFRSESVAGFLLELVAGFVGIRIYALSGFTVQHRIQGWYFKRTDHDDDWRGPFSSEISVCLTIGRALCKELKKRDGV